MRIVKILLIWATLPFLLQLPAGTPAPVKARLYVLSVGVKNYKDSNLNLHYPDKDARDVAAAFQQQANLYDVREVKVLVNENATKNAIRSELMRFQGKVNSNDLFLFLFSGHGLEDRLAPYDFSRNDPYGTSLLKEDMKELLEQLGCNYVLLLDACHSGSLAKNIGKALTVEEVAAGSRKLYEALGAFDKMQMIVGSSASNQLSFECDPCQNGYFAENVLNAFANKKVSDEEGNQYRPDENGDGMVSVYEFSTYMQDAVRIMTAEAKRQTSDPRFQIQKVYSSVKTSANMPFILVGNPSPVPVPARPSDRDRDGIADIADKCPDTPGQEKFQGCPSAVELLKVRPADRALILEALANFPFDGNGRVNLAEAQHMMHWLGIPDYKTYHSNAEPFVYGTFRGGTTVTIWVGTYGKTDRYGVRYGKQDLSYHGSNDTYFEVIRR